MTQTQLFQRRAGSGWLVISGGGEFAGEFNLEILGQVFSGAVSHNPFVYIGAAGSSEDADAVLDAIADIGGRTGYVVDIITEDDETLWEQIAETGIVIIGDGGQDERLASGLQGAALEAISAAYENGATVFGHGVGGLVLAAWWIGKQKAQAGFGWLEKAVVVINKDEETAPEIDLFHQFLSDHPDLFGFIMKPGAAVAFAPDGNLEVWGNKEVTIALGKNFAKIMVQGQEG